MKKTLIIILIMFVTYLSLTNSYDKNFIIPVDAIRLRVIPNSNSEEDQKIKTKVSQELQYNMNDLLKDVEDIKEARYIINNNINYIDTKILKLLKQEKYELKYDLNFGKNFFPEKKYKGITYPEGYYESLRVTLGEGMGNNWWCVLFPPLCLIETEETTEVEYKFFVREIINRYFGI